MVQVQASFLRSYRHQLLPFPDSICYYIIKHPSTKVYQKMVQTCKFFFVKNPIILIERIFFNYRQIWVACSEQNQLRLNKSKIWITDKLEIFYGINQNSISSLIPRLYRCDAKSLYFLNQILSYNEFLFLSSKVEKFIFVANSIVVDKINGIVPLERLVKILPKVRKVVSDDFNSSGITFNTVNEFLQLPHFINIYELRLYKASEKFDIDIFFNYIKKNKKLKLVFYSNSTSDAYKKRLEKIIDEILSTKTHEYKVPYIYFNGLAAAKKHKIDMLTKLNV